MKGPVLMPGLFPAWEPTRSTRPDAVRSGKYFLVLDEVSGRESTHIFPAVSSSAANQRAALRWHLARDAGAALRHAALCVFGRSDCRTVESVSAGAEGQ